MASEDEGDLGLVSLLGEDAVSDVGEKCTSESATSGLGDTTVVAAQAPITETGVIVSDGQIMAGSAVPSSLATGNTRLPDTLAQAPIGSTQGSAFSSGRGNEPVQLPSLHHGGEARIPTLFSKGPGGQQSLMNGQQVLQHLVMLNRLNMIIVLLVMLMKCIEVKILIHIPLGM